MTFLKKRSSTIVACVILAIVICGGAWAVDRTHPSDRLSVRADPFSSNYNVDDFSFSDFNDHKELARYLSTHLPKGSSKADVEKLLITTGRAKTTNEMTWDQYKDIPGLGHGYEHRDTLSGFKSHYSVVYKATASQLQSWTVIAHYNEQNDLLLLVSHIYLVK